MDARLGELHIKPVARVWGVDRLLGRQLESKTMKAILLIPLLFCGCAIEKYNMPPQWASAVVHHSRFFGLSVAYQGYGVKMGWGSEVDEVIPCSTNKIFAAPVSDTFKIGQSINPMNTTIIEDIQSGWEGQPPPPRFQKLFAPKEEQTK